MKSLYKLDLTHRKGVFCEGLINVDKFVSCFDINLGNKSIWPPFFLPSQFHQRITDTESVSRSNLKDIGTLNENNHPYQEES